MDKDELFIPTKINKNDKYFKGFGVKEMIRTAIFTGIGLAVGLFVGIMFFNQSFSTILISLILIGSLFAVLGYMFFVRIDINLSLFDFIYHQIHFSKGQKLYLYKREREFY